MNVRVRKLIGTILLVAFVCVYAFLAMVVAVMTLPEQSRAVQIAYYAVAGLVWVIPAGLIILWMERPRG